MNLTDWVVGNLKPYKLALNSPTRIGSFLPTIYGCVLPTLTNICSFGFHQLVSLRSSYKFIV